jgi:hypothetical protein
MFSVNRPSVTAFAVTRYGPWNAAILHIANGGTMAEIPRDDRFYEIYKRTMTTKGWLERLNDQMTAKGEGRNGMPEMDTVEWVAFIEKEIAHARAEEAERCMEREKKAREEGAREEREMIVKEYGHFNDGCGCCSFTNLAEALTESNK